MLLRGHFIVLYAVTKKEKIIPSTQLLFYHKLVVYLHITITFGLM
jgi:hypothetical protein